MVFARSCTPDPQNRQKRILSCQTRPIVPAKMSRTNFFAALDSDDEESRDGADTRKKEMATRMKVHARGGQTAADETESHSWGDIMTGMRYQANFTIRITVPNTTQLHIDFCDEPWKYGDEIINHWDSIVANPEMEEYWRNRDAMAMKPVPNFTPIAKECAKEGAKRWVERDIRKHVARITNAIVKIQKTYRGYKSRCNDPHHDCCMCLSHVFSPLRTAAGYMCRDCAEMGPHEEIFPNDPMNWHRTDYVDEAPNRNPYQCCAWCVREYIAPLWNGDYCSYECEWKDRTA